MDLFLQPGRRQGLRRPHARRSRDGRDVRYPADPAAVRHLLHQGPEQAGRRQGHRPHAVLLADAVPGKSGGDRTGSAPRR